VNRNTPKGPSLESDREEYDSQIAHTIWELEQSVRRGHVTAETRRVLIEAHASQMEIIEERAGLNEKDRSHLLLQSRVSPGILLLADENGSTEDLKPCARFFQRAGFNVLVTTLAWRDRERPAYSPTFWQTCLDESANRFDMLEIYSNRMTILGCGLSAALMVHLAQEKKVQALIALFPNLHSDVSFRDRFKMALSRWMPRRRPEPPAWNIQRRLATDLARQRAKSLQVPTLLVVEDLHDKSELGRSAATADRLFARRADAVKRVPSAQASPRLLPELVLDSLVDFARKNQGVSEPR
jgi:hypothetical protein